MKHWFPAHPELSKETRKNSIKTLDHKETWKMEENGMERQIRERVALSEVAGGGEGGEQQRKKQTNM